MRELDRVRRRRKPDGARALLVPGSIREIVLSSRFVTQTAPAPTATPYGPSPTGMRRSTCLADGSVTIAFTGLVFAIQGAGTAYVDSGRDLIVFSDGGVEPVSSSGPSAVLCEALPATIG
jgi:hypothetical protein